MKKFHGMWWPDAANADVIRYIAHSKDTKVAMKYARNFNTVVQAGGHCGIWAVELAKSFHTVYTFEPEDSNWACLLRNIADVENIVPFHAALGEAPTKIALNVNGKNTGGHKGTKLPGKTVVVTIDGLQLSSCDLIVLDVEGMELPALKGARNTISQFAPVLMLEDRDHGARHGWGSREELLAYTTSLGYSELARVSYDMILVKPC